ncbi:hypothetical protein Cme02nite_32100 [Catellatospora methionotrophica]|uniref:DUF488 family protein n=1 Tax=Catellatospora methionotrophica TaxID=121620 RepID=A0A8J3LB07_9ACTN|nr:DUF488 family protein [Catellatospora methionotrophica]GIG14878.1 hypothetical protein Cme02nite_32100 [Catellatospora methionotrophica]
MPTRRGPAANLRMRRAYEPASPDDGLRVLVDRLWPRGLAKERAHVAQWPKELTPSTELRRWYHEAPEERHEQFVARYEAELDDPAARQALTGLRQALREGTVTLLTAVKEFPGSHVDVLARRLTGKE